MSERDIVEAARRYVETLDAIRSVLPSGSVSSELWDKSQRASDNLRLTVKGQKP